MGGRSKRSVGAEARFTYITETYTGFIYNYSYECINSVLVKSMGCLPYVSGGNSSTGSHMQAQLTTLPPGHSPRMFQEAT